MRVCFAELLFPPPNLCPFCGKGQVALGLPICAACYEKIDLSWQNSSNLGYPWWTLQDHSGLLKAMWDTGSIQQVETIGVLWGLVLREETALANIRKLLLPPVDLKDVREQSYHKSQVMLQGVLRVWPKAIATSVVRVQKGAERKHISTGKKLKDRWGDFRVIAGEGFFGKEVLILDSVRVKQTSLLELARLVSDHHGLVQAACLRMNQAEKRGD